MDVKATITKANPASNKRYVEYHILVQLPFRKYSVNKRYSEFVALAKNMTKEMSADSFPFEVPPKTFSSSAISSMFGDRGVNDNELIGFRTKVFNKMLKDILNDLLWRRCESFIEFLELPNTIFDDFGGHGNGNDDINTMYMKKEWNINDEDDWMEIMRECKGLVEDPTVKNVSIVRNKLIDLKRSLELFGKDLTPDEYNKRQMLVNSIEKELSIRDNNMFNNSSSVARSGIKNGSDDNDDAQNVSSKINKSKMRIFGGSNGSRSPRETEITAAMNNKELLTDQKQQVARQDDTHLAGLYETIKKQKQIGMIINDELEYHNSILNELNNGVDSTGNKVKTASDKTQKMNYSL